jgi:ABC-type dipeptide/oligopeptide/nickel transport system permease component
MTGYILRRTGFMLATLLIVAFLAFAATRMTPGDPIRLMTGDRNVPPEVVEAWRARYGLDQPIPVQFGYYIRNLVRGDLGLSYQYLGTPVARLVLPATVVTLQWQVIALLVATITAVLLGVVAAAHHNTIVDNGAMFFALIGISLPDFVLATFLVIIFSLHFDLLPVAGFGTAAHLVLPVATLAVRPCALLSRMVRASMLDVIREDYVRTARAKGVAEWQVLRRHALQNALLPVLTVIGVLIGRILSGAFIVETIFNIPGIGRVGVIAVLQRDYPVVLAATLILAAAFIIVTLIVDVLYAVIDPRIRYGSG